MINFVKSGDNLTLAAPYDVLSGGGFKVGNVFGVAANDTLSGADVECEVEGVYDLAKDASVFAQGDLAYWDDAAKKVTSTVGSNLLIGAVEVAAATGVATVRVNLFGVPGFSGQAHGLKVAYAKYDFSVDGGATCTPAVSDTIPDQRGGDRRRGELHHGCRRGGACHGVDRDRGRFRRRLDSGRHSQGVAQYGCGDRADVRGHPVQDDGGRQDQRHGRHRPADRGRHRGLGALHHRRGVIPWRRGRNNLVWRTRLSWPRSASRFLTSRAQVIRSRSSASWTRRTDEERRRRRRVRDVVREPVRFLGAARSR